MTSTGAGFAITPKYDCPHIDSLNLKDLSRFVNIKITDECRKCKNIGENWVCLACGSIFCSYYVKKHMLEHFEQEKHPICLSFSDMSIWCNECQSYIESLELYKIRQLFQNKKFSATTTMAEVEKSLGSLGMISVESEDGKVEAKEEGKEFTLENVVSKIKNKKIKKIVVLTGAGLSTSAGIPDFRSPGSGLYANMQKYNLPFPEAVFTLQYFMTNPSAFYELAKGMMGKYFPTKAHYFIRLLQDKGLLWRNYTQNIDNLEIDAGVKPEILIQAHGTISSSHCAICHKEVDQSTMMTHLAKGEVLKCSFCQGPCKPDIVMFGEALPLRFSMEFGNAADADLFIVMGTSLMVSPFSEIVHKAGPNVPRIIIDKVVPEKIKKAADKRDILMVGDCDETCEKLVSMLGFTDEFKKLLKEREEAIKKFEKEKK